MQGWTIGMDPDLDPDLSLFIAVMTLVIGVMPLFIGIITLIRGLVLRLMASLIVHAPQIVYITGMWSEPNCPFDKMLQNNSADPDKM